MKNAKGARATRSNGICVAATGILLSLGCGAEASEQSAGGPNAGLVIDTATAKAGLRGSFTKDGRVVYFAAMRGDKNPTDGLDDSPPEYSVNARFGDDQGRSLIVTGAGDALTQEEREADSQDSDPESVPLYLAMLPEVVDALNQVELPDLLPELEILAQMGNSMRDVELVIKPKGQTDHACIPGYQHVMTFRNKVTFGISKNHTAVKLHSWYRNESCSWVDNGWRQSCNWGACAADPAMKDFCKWESPMRSYPWPTFQHHSSNDSACSTPYSALSAAGNHNCNGGGGAKENRTGKSEGLTSRPGPGGGQGPVHTEGGRARDFASDGPWKGEQVGMPESPANAYRSATGAKQSSA